MKNISILVILISSLVFSSVVFAQATSGSEATAGADATAIANPTLIGGDTSVGVTATGGHSDVDVDAQTGDSSSALNMGDVSPQQSILIQGSKTNIPTPSPLINFPQGNQIPQLFTAPGKSYIEAGIDATEYFNSVCEPKSSAGINTTKRSLSGWWDDEIINFIPHYNHVVREKKAEDPFVSKVSLGKVGVKGHYKCVGVLTATAKPKKALEVSYSSLLNVAQNRIIRDIRGPYSEVIGFIPSGAMVTTPMVSSDSFGLGVGTGMAGSPTAMFFGAGTGISSNSANTFPKALVGFTMLLFAPTTADDPDAILLVYVSEEEAEEMRVKALLNGGIEKAKQNSVIQQQ